MIVIFCVYPFLSIAMPFVELPRHGVNEAVFVSHTVCSSSQNSHTCRWKLDLYSTEVAIQRRERVLEPAHTMAIYQLRRFVVSPHDVCVWEGPMLDGGL